MTSKKATYRQTHPEYYEAEKKKDAERMNNKYANDPEFRKYMKNYYKERYQRLKAEKNSIVEFLQNFH